MLSAHTRAKIRQLEIVTKRLMDGPLIGDDVSARRGYGVELDQLRDYQFGDDVRFIDFKSSCRLNRMMVKECVEERNRQIVLAVDVSASSFYGSTSSRFALIQDATAILMLAAHYAHDSVGFLLFSDDIEYACAPAHTHSQVNFLLQKIYDTSCVHVRKTDMNKVFKHIARDWHKDAIVFVISDFIVDDIEQSLRAAAASVDLVAVRCYDPLERHIPPVGFVMVEDVEHETCALVESKSGSGFGRSLEQRMTIQDALFARLGIDVLDVSPNCDVCACLIDFFRRRMAHARVRHG